jgi:amino acid transporter
MVVVPKQIQIEGASVAESFFRLTYGALSRDDNTGARIFSAFLAISSLGNIIVMTYTAARVKQEIAKEGLLPWPKFFGQNKDLSFGRLLRWAQRTRMINRPFGSILRLRWLAPELHSERTPVGALVLHLLTCTILLFATYGQTPQNAYLLLTGIAAYVVNACFGSLLAAGILYLRFSKARDWRHKSTNIHPWLSVAAATVYLIGNLFPVITSWVKPEKSLSLSLDTGSNTLLSTDRGTSNLLSWFLVPTVGWAVLGFAALWWLGASFVVRRIERHTHTEFTIQREFDFDEDPPGSGAYVQVHETVYLSWKAREILRDMTMHGDAGVTGMMTADPFAGYSGMAGGGFVNGGGGGMNGVNGVKGMNVNANASANDYYGRYP